MYQYLCFVLLLSVATASESVSVEKSTEEDSKEVSATIDVYQVLQSIENKLKPLEILLDTPVTNGSPLVAWFQGALVDRLARRLDAVEVKLDHLETRFESRFDKIEEMGRSIWGQSVDNINKQVEKATDKISSEVDSLQNKMFVMLESWSSKLESIENRVENDMNSMTSRLLQMELTVERLTDEIAKTSHSDCSNKLESHWKEIKNQQQKLVAEVSKINALKNGSGLSGHGQVLAHNSQPTDSLNNAMADDTSINSNLEWTNLTSTLSDAVLIGNKKFNELDNDIEIYTRKVLNAYQELIKESKDTKDLLQKVTDYDNQTKIVIREGFRKLFQQMKPLTS
ncbi:hypothetical protein CHUAL_002282 [Chamberlinius hualienensis]